MFEFSLLKGMVWTFFPLLTKVYWKYASDIVWVRVTATSPTNLKLDVNGKSNIQVRFGSKAMGSLYELFCHSSLSSLDSFLDEFLSYLPTRFSSIIFLLQYICFPLRRFNLFLLNFRKWCLCSSNTNVPASGTDTEAVYKAVGYTHTNKGLPESLVEIQ